MAVKRVHPLRHCSACMKALDSQAKGMLCKSCRYDALRSAPRPARQPRHAVASMTLAEQLVAWSLWRRGESMAAIAALMNRYPYQVRTALFG